MPKTDTDWRQQMRRLLDGPIRAAGVQQTARQIGISDPTLHRWLQGHNSIGPEKIKLLAKLFDYQVIQRVEKIPEKSTTLVVDNPI